MKLRLISNKKEKLFSGLEDDYYTNESEVQINNDVHFLFNAYSCITNRFYKLESLIDFDEIKNIAEKSNLTKVDYDNMVFKGEWDLGVAYFYKKPYLILFTSGEARKGVYGTYKEAVWYAPNLNIPDTVLRLTK